MLSSSIHLREGGGARQGGMTDQYQSSVGQPSFRSGEGEREKKCRKGPDISPGGRNARPAAVTSTSTKSHLSVSFSPSDAPPPPPLFPAALRRRAPLKNLLAERERRRHVRHSNSFVRCLQPLFPPASGTATEAHCSIPFPNNDRGGKDREKSLNLRDFLGGVEKRGHRTIVE